VPASLAWIVVCTQASRPADTAIADKGFEIFSPKLRRTSRRGGRKHVLFGPMFPNYLFVNIAPNDLATLLGVRGVRGVLMTAEGNPAVVSKAEMDALRERCDSHHVFIPATEARFEQGQLVRVKTGPLAGHIGLFDNLVGNREAALLDFLGCKTRTLFKLGDLAAA
jgi:transcription antitermination factor NusG